MRDHYSDFAALGAEIIAVGPDTMKSFQEYWARENIPFIGLPDPDHGVSKIYRQEVNLFKLGRMPLNCVLDLNGQMRYIHYGSSMSDIPDNETFLNVIEQLNASSNYVTLQPQPN
jgi:peroxiredoxin